MGKMISKESIYAIFLRIEAKQREPMQIQYSEWVHIKNDHLTEMTWHCLHMWKGLNYFFLASVGWNEIWSI